jgi:hypothetical protein
MTSVLLHLALISLIYLAVTEVCSLIVELISNVVDLSLNLVTPRPISSAAISMMHNIYLVKEFIVDIYYLMLMQAKKSKACNEAETPQSILLSY